MMAAEEEELQCCRWLSTLREGGKGYRLIELYMPSNKLCVVDLNDLSEFQVYCIAIV